MAKFTSISLNKDKDKVEVEDGQIKVSKVYQTYVSKDLIRRRNELRTIIDLLDTLNMPNSIFIELAKFSSELRSGIGTERNKTFKEIVMEKFEVEYDTILSLLTYDPSASSFSSSYSSSSRSFSSSSRSSSSKSSSSRSFSSSSRSSSSSSRSSSSKSSSSRSFSSSSKSSSSSSRSSSSSSRSSSSKSSSSSSTSDNKTPKPKGK